MKRRRVPGQGGFSLAVVEELRYYDYEMVDFVIPMNGQRAIVRTVAAETIILFL